MEEGINPNPITPQAFSQKIKEKYPQYKDVDDVMLAKKMVEKYPEYASQVVFEQVKKKVQDSGSISAPVKSASETGIGSSATSDVNPFKSVGIPGQLPTAPTNIAAKPAAKLVSGNKVKAKTQPVKTEEEDDYSFLDYAADNLGAGVDYLAKSAVELPEMAYDMLKSKNMTDSLDKLIPVVPAGTIARKALEFLDPTKDKKATAEDIKKFYGIRNVPAEALRERINTLNQGIEQQNQKYGGDVLSAIQNDRYGDAAKMIAGTTIQSLPIMAAAIMSGGSTAGNTAIGLSTASQKYADLKDENPDLSTDKKLANAGVSGLLEATIGTLVEGVSGQAIKKIISSKGAEEGAKIVANGFRSMFAKAVEKNPALSVLGEVIEESTVAFGDQLNDINSGIRNELDFHEIANAGLSAVGMGAATTVPVYAAKAYVGAKDYKEAKAVNKQIFKLQNELNNPDISETTKTEITKNIDELVKHNQSIVQKGKANIEALHPDVKEKLVESITTIESLKEKAQAIKDDNSSPETKKVLLANLKQEAKEANKVKDKILKGEATVLDTLPDNMQEELKRKADSEIRAELTSDGKTFTSKQLDEATTEDKILAKANEIYENARPSKAKVEEKTEKKEETISNNEVGIVPLDYEKKTKARIHDLSLNEAALSESETRELSELRGERDSYITRLDNELQSISSRYGGETNAESFSGQDRQRWELLQGELQVVNDEGAVDQQKRQQEIRVQEPNTDVTGNISTVGSSSDNSGLQTDTERINDMSGSEFYSGVRQKEESDTIPGTVNEGRSDSQNSGNGKKDSTVEVEKRNEPRGSDTGSSGEKESLEEKSEIDAGKKDRDSSSNGGISTRANKVGEGGVSADKTDTKEDLSSTADGNSSKRDSKVEHNGITYSKNESGNWVNLKTKNEVKGIGVKGKALIAELDKKSKEQRGKNKEERVDSGEDTDVPTTKEPVKEEKPEAKEPKKEPVKEEKTEAKEESKESKGDFEKKKGKRSVFKRASEGEFTTVKNAIKRYSLDYDVENQEKAKENADAFVEELKKEFGFEDGINAALNAVRSGQITGAEKAFVYDKVIRDVNQEIENAIGEERADLEELNTEILGEVMDEFAKEGTKAGQFISALGKIYTGSMGMYNLTKRVADYKAANNGVISDEVLKKFTEADAKIKELEAKLDEMQKEKVRLEEEQSLKDIIEEVARQVKVGKTAQIKSTAKAQAFADKLRSFKTTSLGGAMAATPVSLAYDAAIEIAARTIETSGKIADAISEGIAYIRKQKLGKQEEQQVIGQFVNAFSQSEGEQKPITIGDDGKLKIPHSIIRGHVENGIDTVEDLVEAVQNDVNEMFPDNDFTEREVRDAITRYGKTINPTTDEIEQEIGRMNSLGRLISGIEDALGGQRPLKSGLQRREVTKEERKMQRELKELLRDLPMDDADLAKTWKTALDSIKTRLANEIEQLDDQIAAGEKRKAERKTIELDDEAKGLKEIRDAKRKELDELVGKPELTYEEKVAKAIKNTEDAVVKLQEKIASGDLAYKNKPTPVTSDKLESLRAQKKALEQQINEMRQDSGLAEMKRLQTAKQARLNRIKELKRRIQEKDFSTKKPKPLPVDAEILEIERQLLEQKAIFDKEKYKQELNDQHVFKKWWDRVGNVLGLPRLLKAGGEFSAVLMQMGFLTTEMLVKNPKAVFKGISMLGKAFTSNTTAQKYETMVKTHPLYPLMQKAKLTLTGTDHRIDATEEAFQLDLVNDTWNQIGEGLNRVTGNKEVLTPLGKLKSLLGKEVTADDRKMAGEQFKDSNLWKMFERGAVTYSNYVKVMKFEEGAKELMKQGYDPINDFEQYKQLAKYINIFSGRANLGRAEMVSKDLAVVFFSARMAVSQFQQLNPLFYAGLADWSNVKGITSLNKVKSTVAQKMAVKSFITSFATITGFSLAFMAAANAASDDDDEKWTFETDPRSSDFGKLRKGEFTFDMWHGLGTWAVFLARTLSQQTKKRDTGEISDLGVGKTDTYGELGIKFIGNKFSPTASFLWRLMWTHPEIDPNTGEVYRVDPYGNIFGEDETMDLLKPIYANAVNDIAKEDPDAWQSFLTAIGALGANVGVEKEKEKFKDVTGGMPSLPSMPKMPKFPGTK